MPTDSKTPEEWAAEAEGAIRLIYRSGKWTPEQARPFWVEAIREAMAQARREAFRLCSDVDRGVAGDVAALNAWGLQTTDSGDGSKAEWMEGAMEVPNITVRLADGQVPHDCLLHLGPPWEVVDEFEADAHYCVLTMTPEED